MSAPRVLVIGGGVSGLTFARYLARYHPTVQCVLAEKSSRLGGWVQSRQHDIPTNEAENSSQVTLEYGPRGLISRGGLHTVALVESLGLADRLVVGDSSAKRRYLWSSEQSEQAAQSDGDVSSVRELALSLQDTSRKVFSFWPPGGLLWKVVRGAWRDVMRPWSEYPQHTDDGKRRDLSVHQWMSSRFSEDASGRSRELGIANSLFDPVCAGIFATHPNVLSARWCFPALTERMRVTGKGLFGAMTTGSKYSFDRHGLQGWLYEVENGEGEFSLTEKAAASYASSWEQDLLSEKASLLGAWDRTTHTMQDSSGASPCEHKLLHNEWDSLLREDLVASESLLSRIKKGSLFSFDGGMETLIDGLASDLESHDNVEVRTNCAIDKMRVASDGSVEVETPGSTERYDFVYSAVNAHDVATMLPSSSLSETLNELPFASITLVHIAFDKQGVVPSDLRGFGFLKGSREGVWVHDGDDQLRQDPVGEWLLGCTFDSYTFPTIRGSSGDYMTMMFGAPRSRVNDIADPPALWDGENTHQLFSMRSTDRPSDSDFKAFARRVLRQIGVRESPTFSQVTAVDDCIPVMRPFHSEWVDTVTTALSEMGPSDKPASSLGRQPVHMLGTSVAGVAVNDLIGHSLKSALMFPLPYVYHPDNTNEHLLKPKSKK